MSGAKGQFWLRLVVLSFVAALVLTNIPLGSVNAIDTSPWLVGDPTLSDKTDLELGKLTPTTLNANRDCQPRKVVTQRLAAQDMQVRDGCIVDTGYGAYDKSGLLQRQGTSVSGEVRNKFGGTASMAPIPQSGTGLIFTGNAVYGSYTALIPNLDGYLRTDAWPNGTVTHYMNPSTPYQLITDRSGQPLPLMYDSLAYSSNGNWLIADVPYIGFVRINLNTREVLPFSDPTNFSVAVGAFYRTAISPDGRYAVVASHEFPQFKIYDLATCGTVPDHITGKVACQSKNLLPLMKQVFPGYASSGTIRFRGNFNLELHVSYMQGTMSRVAHAYLTAAGQTVSGFDYLGMGDSFASGEGAFEYKALTDTKDNMCHLSMRSYPYLISKQLSFGQYESVACSGAKIKNVVGAVEDKGTSQAKRSTTLENSTIFNDFLPGYLPQKEFVSEKSPSIITVSTVGNDIGFSDIIKRCVSGDTCYGFYEERLELIRSIDSQFPRLSAMYSDLKQTTPPMTRIYAIAYPKLSQPNGNCAANVRLNQQELMFANDLVDYLNQMIERAAKRAGVFYTDVSGALDGHRFCETESWQVAANGITAGKDAKLLGAINLPIGNESFHPNALGHDMLKNTILGKTNNLTAPMPIAQPALEQPKVTSGVPVLDNAPRSNRSIRQLRSYDEMGGDLGTRGEVWQGSTNSTIKLQPGSTANVEIHSTPTDLGSFTVGADGRLNFSVTVPANLEPGIHTMHILGKNVAGEEVDLEKVVYVAQSPEDYDGDGSPNDIDPCPTISQSGQDTDQDGADDACDPLIDQPPPPPVIPIPDPVLPVEVADPDPITVGPEPTIEESPPLVVNEPETTPQEDIVQPTVTPQETAPLLYEDSPIPTENGKELPQRESDPWSFYVDPPEKTPLSIAETTTALSGTPSTVSPALDTAQSQQPQTLGAETATSQPQEELEQAIAQSKSNDEQRSKTNQMSIYAGFAMLGLLALGLFVLRRFRF